MKRTTLVLVAFSLLTAQLFTDCRRPLEDEYHETALISVRIDWSQSNIPVSDDDPSGGEWVHRATLRFYPADGSPVFERYLEGNIFEGTIEVPVGYYKVIVMNESIEDVRYWEDFITFSGVDSFDDFAATVNPMPEAGRLSRFPFYKPSVDERIIVEPLRLASWSLDGFEVTMDMVAASRGYGSAAKAATLEMLAALNNIAMRALTCNINVEAHVRNLVSVQALHTAAQGFADKVYMASALTVQEPATYPFLLNGRTWDENKMDGTTRRTFLSFGRLPQESEYTISLDVLFVNGELYTAGEPMSFDVTDQVMSSTGSDINIVIPDMNLPYVEGGISVDGWDDEEITLM